LPTYVRPQDRTTCPYGHPLAGENLAGYHLRRGHRKCRTCNRATARASRNRWSHEEALADVLADPAFEAANAVAEGRA